MSDESFKVEPEHNGDKEHSGITVSLPEEVKPVLRTFLVTFEVVLEMLPKQIVTPYDLFDGIAIDEISNIEEVTGKEKLIGEEKKSNGGESHE